LTPEEIISIQNQLGLSDTKLAAALGITRQTWSNWRRGKPCPPLARNAIRWMLTIRRIDPANDNLPQAVRFLAVLCLMVVGA
jgi:DNA-binding transcriptional regulator YiaG